MRTIAITPKLVSRFLAKVDVKSANECWPWRGLKNKWGYGQIGIGQEMVTATHVALTIAGQARPGSLFALHHCDNPACCNPSHLYWGSQIQNVADRQKRGRCGARGASPGASNHQAKLNDELVREIRSSPLGVTALARKYGVSNGTIGKIVRFKTWTHVT
jgi:hypothetical protein